MSTRRFIAWLPFVMLAACVPDVDDDDTLVAVPRILAISATPAEVTPRESVTLRALYADTDGEIKTAPLDWALCAERKALSELGPLNPSCLKRSGDTVLPLGEGVTAKGTMPADACRLFGPEPAPPKEGEPAGRAVDPDPTGGFYQPGRVYDPETKLYAIFETRVRCNLAGVTQEVFADFNRRYRENTNPAVQRLAARAGGADIEIAAAGEGDPIVVKAGKSLSLRASWAACSASDEGCTGAEHYVYFDAQERRIRTRRETVRVSWFATSGDFAEARTGRIESEASKPYSDNTWTAPGTAGDVALWVVLRDDRGGTAWRQYTVSVVR